MEERLTDLTAIDREKINSIIASGKTATIQFSQPTYDRSLLTAIDSLCREYGDCVEVRFFGHYSGVFDASALSQIPHVQWLSIDCLTSITALEHLFALPGLRKLSLGVFELDVPDILSRISLQGLRELSLGETRQSNIDLSPLAQCMDLSRLRVASHCVGLSVLSRLEKLIDLSLCSFPKKQTLEVVSAIPELKKLALILGGRPNIDEIHHPRLEELEVVRVLGLSSIGNLGRFPSLKKLRVEDQIRLETLHLETASAELQQLALYNCKNLRRLNSLGHLTKLHDLGIGRTDLDLDSLLASRLPPSLRSVRFWTGTKKTNAVYRAKLDALGYTQFSR